MSNPSNIGFENCQPILRVENMQRALHFYVDLLGFKAADWSGDNFSSISKDRAGIYLCRQAQGHGAAWVWIGVDDAEKLHEEYVALGIKIRLPPTNYFYAMEFHIEDPDGNVLRLGSDPKTDRPFETRGFDES
jgi:predicted enzyme related to lactoylglutathione lyase